MIKKIAVEHLEPGMFVTDMNTPWVNHPFLTGRRLLRSAADIDTILKHGITHVYIDPGRGKDSAHAVAVVEADRDVEDKLLQEVDVSEAAGDEEPGAPRPQDPFDVEMDKAREIYHEAFLTVEQVFRTVEAGGQIEAERPRAVVTNMISSIFRNPDALLSLARIKGYDTYTFHHSINVAVLVLTLGTALGILDDELLRLGVGAILHDVGKVLVPAELIRRPGPLTPAEFAQMKQHTALGARLLLQAPGIPDDAAAVPLNHHERYDGSGYPRALSGISVGKFGLVAAIPDVYDAMTTRRPYQQAFPPVVVLRRLYEWGGTRFHPLYVRHFIRQVGIYPAGTVLRLDTGETAVVVRQNRHDPVRPWVRIVTTPEGRPLPTPLDVDLREEDPAGEKPYARAVDTVIPAQEAGIDVNAIMSLPWNPACDDDLPEAVQK